MQRRRVIFLLLPQTEALDLGGPLQVYREAVRLGEHYEIRYCSPKERVVLDGGLVVSELEPLPAPEATDLIIVPGMPYDATMRVERSVHRWLREAERAGCAIASVCTGAFVLADAGILRSRHCTTHWARIADLRLRAADAIVLEDRLHVSDGAITTSAGIASGIDMALSLLERDHGPLFAAEVAREMVVYVRRDGSQRQQSIYTEFRTHLNAGVHRVQDWLVRNPAIDASIGELADVAGMSPRHLTRSFRAATGVTIQQFTTRLRVELAQSLMHDPSLTVEAIAERCGLRSARQLRRIWRDAHGSTPRAR